MIYTKANKDKVDRFQFTARKILKSPPSFQQHKLKILCWEMKTVWPESLSIGTLRRGQISFIRSQRKPLKGKYKLRLAAFERTWS